MAARKNRTAIAELLIKSGADIYAKSCYCSEDVGTTLCSEFDIILLHPLFYYSYLYYLLELSCDTVHTIVSE